MGSKSPEHNHQNPHASNSNLKPTQPDGNRARNGAGSTDLDRGVISDDDDDDDDDDTAEAAGLTTSTITNLEKKKKQKKPKKKKKKKNAHAVDTQESHSKQESLLPVSALNNKTRLDYPSGELVPYENNSRITNEELRYDSRLWDEGFLAEYRQAAEIHRHARQIAQKEFIYPGATLQSITEAIEDVVRTECGHQGLDTGDALKAGMGFPTGLCLNNVAAHWTPNPGGKDIILQKSDVLKIDFGVHVNGRIVDSAFTVTFDPIYDNLVTAVKEATNTGILHAGVDARICDIGAAIQEVMESYEVDIGGKTFPVKAIRSITGHDILQYRIHGNKQIPFVKNKSQVKMEEGEVFAIETFGSTGKGWLQDDVGVYGYGRNSDLSGANLRLSSAKSLLKTIDANFGTLVFCRRYLERLDVKKYHLGMKNLIDNGIIDSYAPLVDIKGSFTAQFEHTILLHSGGKEVISRGDDY